MRCKFCFATFQDMKRTILPKGHLPQRDALKVVELIAEFGFQKVTFAGGEPTLCPWLGELIATAKTNGMTTMIVTNGSNLSDEFLSAHAGSLDWITLSIDSLNPSVNLQSGRAIVGKRAMSADHYRAVVERIKNHGYKLKLNTVVHRLNFMEDMSEFIAFAAPSRWKVLQILPIAGENDDALAEMEISSDQFQQFVLRHSFTISSDILIAEDNNAMRGSYVMVDPAGRFFDNSNEGYIYSHPITDVGIEKALKGINLNYSKFIGRNGIYKW